MRIGLFISWHIDAFFPEVGIATLELMERLTALSGQARSAREAEAANPTDRLPCSCRHLPGTSLDWRKPTAVCLPLGLKSVVGSCVTSIAGPNGDSQLYER